MCNCVDIHRVRSNELDMTFVGRRFNCRDSRTFMIFKDVILDQVFHMYTCACLRVRVYDLYVYFFYINIHEHIFTSVDFIYNKYSLLVSKAILSPDFLVRFPPRSHRDPFPRDSSSSRFPCVLVVVFDPRAALQSCAFSITAVRARRPFRSLSLTGHAQAGKHTLGRSLPPWLASALARASLRAAREKALLNLRRRLLLVVLRSLSGK